MALKLAIVGRPNVGKSTLFNRLAGRKLAIVDDQPGVTRDRKFGMGRIGDIDLELIDTAGFEDVADESLEARMRAQTERAIDEADVALGAFRLGLGEPVASSAEHGEGMADLYAALAAMADEQEALAEDDADKPVRIAIVGRPNAGKSTLVNKLVGEDRLLTGPEAGITRDSIAVDWIWRGRPLRLVDTAGLRRKPRVEGKLEQLSVGDALRSIRFAETVILVVDALQGLERQDLTIARLVEDEGRALVLALNKWDLISEPAALMKHLRER